MTINQMFKKQCEEIGIPYRKFPYRIKGNSPQNWDWPSIIAGMIWILEKKISTNVNTLNQL